MPYHPKTGLAIQETDHAVAWIPRKGCTASLFTSFAVNVVIVQHAPMSRKSGAHNHLNGFEKAGHHSPAKQASDGR
jgi:hypothetical protein